MSLAVPTSAFRLLSGELKSFTMVCDSGRTKECFLCTNCGTRIYHQVVQAAISIKAGTLDDTSSLQPSAHYWTKSKQSWVPIPAGARCFEDDG